VVELTFFNLVNLLHTEFVVTTIEILLSDDDTDSAIIVASKFT
jgi:hypothetical protein